jgi:hypothetical protein
MSGGPCSVISVSLEVNDGCVTADSNYQHGQYQAPLGHYANGRLLLLPVKVGFEHSLFCLTYKQERHSFILLFAADTRSFTAPILAHCLSVTGYTPRAIAGVGVPW